MWSSSNHRTMRTEFAQMIDEYKTHSAHMNACLKGVDALGRLTVVEKDGYGNQFKVLKINF